MARTVPPIKTTKQKRSPDAFDLKLALMEYFRFTRQWVCVDECLLADVVADTGKTIIEVEVKVSKYDLLKGEERSRRKINKHKRFKVQWSTRGVPNMYYFCVPIELGDDALKYVEGLNPKYGVIVYDPNTKMVQMIKGAARLHSDYCGMLKHQIAKRCSAKIITLMQKQAKKREQG
jgi:hypothetical protein